MSGAGGVRTASGGLLRHKVQAVVIGLVLLVSTASATLGFALLAATNAPFDSAFSAQRGAAATGNAAGVSSATGPYSEVRAVQSQLDGQPWGGINLVGRAQPGGTVDDLVLNAGHWVTGPGQVVMSGSPSPGGPQPLQVGSVFTVGSQKLTVVGFAN